MTEDKASRGRGPARTTRQDWLQVALDTLISDGVEQVKVLVLAEKLECARSSFYWYFKDRSDLLDGLLDHWQSTNTQALVNAAKEPAQSINFALGHLFASWVGDGKFNTQLDFAVRDWARRSGTVRRAIDLSDAARIEAIAGMFLRFEYPSSEADVRARIIYFTQIGYYALEVTEPVEARMAYAAPYLRGFSGVEPEPEDLIEFEAFVDRFRDPG